MVETIIALVDISAVKEHEQIDENRLRALMDDYRMCVEVPDNH